MNSWKRACFFTFSHKVINNKLMADIKALFTDNKLHPAEYTLRRTCFFY